MKKAMLPLFLVLTILVVAAGGLLPFLLSPEKQDAVHSVPLQLVDYGEEIGRKSLTIQEKLCILNQGGQRISVSPDIMEHSVEEMIRAAKEDMEQYIRLGLLTIDLAETKIEAYPCIIFSSNTGEKFSKYWDVFLYADGGKYQIVCLMDDDTGKLITISCEFFDSYMILGDPQEKVQSLAELYFRDLGIEDVKVYDGFEGENALYYQTPDGKSGRILVEFLYWEYDVGSHFQITLIPDVAW